ncbi:zinc-binding dehydrogenase [Pseudocolwellia agarivorans]|uniref:zinc-binding dehydrogenase n=1 Tax=Pseudocolwellia agarivorans TaxID=1911682 RepID=UPI0009865470|nr:zinc-binding dehydrogenase [Pseudocolwellia agarivorans]
MIKNEKVVVHRCARGYKAATHVVSEAITKPGKGEIRIRNHFAGVNGLFDQMAMQGRVGYIPLSAPFDLGVEAVGIIEAIGEDVSLNIGDAVATTNLGGAYRHRQIIDATKVYLIPKAIPEYLAIVPTGISALVALEQVAELKQGELVVISAAAGGLGHIWVQLAVNMGCRVIGIAGGDDKCAFVESLGAERCINYKVENIKEVLSSLYKDVINVAVDTVGGVIFDAMVDNIAPLGRVVVSGYASEIVDGAKPVLHPRIYSKLYWKGASVRGFMNALLAEYHRDAAERLFAMMTEGKLSVAIDETSFKGLEALPRAAEHMMKGLNIGKTVLDLREAQ